MPRFAISLALLAAASPALAAPTDPAALDMRVAAFTGAMPGTEGGARAAVDRRLHLAECAADPKLSWRTERQDAVVIECAGPVPWRIFVPVKRSAPVTPTVIAARPEAAALPPVKLEPVIRRGDPVALTVETGGFSVSQDGVALSDAAPGASLRIKIEGKPLPVQAVAVDVGKATVPAG